MLMKSESQAIAEIETRLVAEYSELAADDVRGAIERARKQFERSTVRDFVPLLVERRVHADLASA